MITGIEIYNVLASIVPLYVPMILAYGSVCWWKIFTPEQCSGINRFVAVFAVPFLNFHFLAFANPYAMNLRFIAADTLQKVVILCALIAWSTLTKCGTLDWTLTLFSLSSLPNTVVVGVPLLTAMYGDSSASLMSQIFVMQGVLWITLMLFLYEYRAAMRLIAKQFPQNAGAIASLTVHSDVSSLDGDQPLQTDTEVGQNGDLHVTLRSPSCHCSVASSTIQRASSFNTTRDLHHHRICRTHAPFYGDRVEHGGLRRGHGSQDHLGNRSCYRPRRGVCSDQEAQHAPQSGEVRFRHPGRQVPRDSTRAPESADTDLLHQLSPPRRGKAVPNDRETGTSTCHRSSASPTLLLRSLGGSKNRLPHQANSAKARARRIDDCVVSKIVGVWHPVRKSRTHESPMSGRLRSRAHAYYRRGTSRTEASLRPRSSKMKHATIDIGSSPKSVEDREIEIAVVGIQHCVSEGPKEVKIEDKNANKKQQMPRASVMTRLILTMVSRNLMRNPNTYACVLGLGWSLISFRWNIKMPSIVNGSILILSKTGTGMAMFSLGLFMALQPKTVAGGNTWAAISMIARFFVGPSVIAITSFVIGIRGVLLRVAIVQAALPQAITSFVFAKEYNLHADIFSTAVILGTVVSLPVTIIYFVLLGL
uniref:Auxin efflux carrier component n=2 Tax=Cajanus cajan TaxID=3821 RepID=A0A151R0Z8_CAJCA|nr:Auxin efflux carrier component 3 [Cajanus cajan]